MKNINEIIRQNKFKDLYIYNNIKMNALVFGAHGSIGNYIYNSFKKEGIHTIGTTRNIDKVSSTIIYVDNNNLDNLKNKNIDKISIIVWAHGHNFNDNINDFIYNNFSNMIEGNVSFILNTLNYLLKEDKIINGAKLVIISSIWEEFTRENKLSYSISKSALSGLVKNVSYDLSAKNILINNVLPGVIDNDMSRKTLGEDQMNYIKNYMNFGRLIDLDDVYKTVKFLVCENSGITGQSIKVDLGFTNLRKYN
jgi:NAD(P)-dependent dehydrogenase (short-subunit alcohol dehydrogenase family)